MAKKAPTLFGLPSEHGSEFFAGLVEHDGGVAVTIAPLLPALGYALTPEQAHSFGWRLVNLAKEAERLAEKRVKSKPSPSVETLKQKNARSSKANNLAWRDGNRADAVARGRPKAEEADVCCICGAAAQYDYDEREDSPTCGKAKCDREIQGANDYHDEVGCR